MIRPCPTCRGRGVNDVFARISSPNCNMCNGSGKVDGDNVCRCGRPAVILIGDTLTCTRVACQDVVLGKVNKDNQITVTFDLP